MPYKDPLKRKEYRKLHYRKNRELYIERAAKWNKENPERRKKISRRDNKKRAFLKKLWAEKKKYGTTLTKKNSVCYICGISNDEAKNKYKKGLNVHHIDGNNGKKGKPLNNKKSNLINLCVSCHTKVHNKWFLKNVYKYKK